MTRQLSLPHIPPRPTRAEIRAEVKARIAAGFAVRQAERERKRAAARAKEPRRASRAPTNIQDPTSNIQLGCEDAWRRP
jgi:hypothetical protein